MATERRWLYGPVPDLLLGCGLVYLVFFAALAAAGAEVRSLLPLGLAFVPVNLIGSAHYGATLVRVYERGEERRAYRVFAVWVTVLLGAAFVVSLGSVAAGSWLMTIYLTWSPWHYAGQNFGISMLFLRRRGVAVTARARRLLHASFALSFVLAFLSMHGTRPIAAYAPNAMEAGDYAFLPLGLPEGLVAAALPAAAAAWLLVTAGAIVLLRRAATLRVLFPALALVGTQSLWFSVPVLARHFHVLPGVDPLSAEHALYTFLWIGACHGLQYVWITSWYARQAGTARRIGGFLVRSLLAGVAIWTVPALLFAPGALGRVPYDAGLAMMVASLVNLHHFVLDGVIWKLRDGRISKLLLGGATSPAPAPAPAPAWAGRALLSAGFGVLAVAGFGMGMTEFGFNRALRRGDLAGAARAADLLEWVGQASAEMRQQIGSLALERGEIETARRCFERSVDVRPTAWGWFGVGEARARRAEWREAAEAYERALELDAHHAAAAFHLAMAEWNLGREGRAYSALERAARLVRSDPDADPALRAAVEDAVRRAAPDRGGEAGKGGT